MGGILYFYVQYTSGLYETPAGMERIEFVGESANFSEITYVFFFLMMTGMAINYYGMFFIFPYFVRPWE